MKTLLLFLFFCSSYALFSFSNKTNQAEPRRKANHQGRFFLKNINEGRRILASGMLRNIAKVFGLDIPVLGPAANMYRMKWSRQLEDIAAKNVENMVFNVNHPILYDDINIEGYRGFYWIHDIMGVVRNFLKKYGLDFDLLLNILKKFQTVLETFMMIIWAFTKLVGNYPNFSNPESGHSGPLEVFFADRYEFGCSFKIYAMCFVRDGQHESLYKLGVPCTQCPTFCEFTENIDGTIDEGDMCVPPSTSKLAPAPMPEYEFSTSLNLNFLLVVVVSIISVAMRG